MEFGKVTAVFGPNSSGKTSLIQFLLMLKQTAESRDRRILNLGGTERDYVDLGSYEDVVYGHNQNDQIVFEIHWVNDMLWGIKHSCMANAAMTYKNERIALSEVTFTRIAEYLDGNFDFKQSGRIKLVAIEPSNNSLQVKLLFSPKYDLSPKDEIVPLTANTLFDIYFPLLMLPINSEFESSAKDVLSVGEELAHKLTQCYYLGPLREYPKREYRWTGETPQSIGIRGEYAVPAMLSQIQTVESAEQAELIEGVSKWLKRFGVIDELDLSSISKNSRLFELKIKSRNYAHWANLMDVGFGVSQVLPVIVLAHFAPPGSTIILEQPEIHLHPSVQAELADLFLEVALTRNVQFFIESHSEHLLMRLQRRIAERSGEFANLTENDVKLYFCKRETDASTLEPLAMDEYGRIKNWPKEFFGDPLGERAAMTKAMLARKMAMNGQNGHKA